MNEKEKKTERKEALKALLDISIENRRNEIDLYWRRTSYFWIFISILLTCYVTVFLKIFNDTKNVDDIKSILLVLVSFVGIIFSSLWFLSLRASKYWQENWEGHVDSLTEMLYGDLFGVVKKTKDKGKVRSLYSVSKINGAFAIIFIIIWCMFFIHSTLELFFGIEFLSLMKSYISSLSNCCAITLFVLVIASPIFCLFIASSKIKSKHLYRRKPNWCIKKPPRK